MDQKAVTDILGILLQTPINRGIARRIMAELPKPGNHAGRSRKSLQELLESGALRKNRKRFAARIAQEGFVFTFERKKYARRSAGDPEVNIGGVGAGKAE